jgi:hypothetical protein
MLWAEICQAYPNQWLIIEALEAHTTPDKQRHLDCLAVVDTCPDGSAALQRYAVCINNIHSGNFTLCIRAAQNLISANENG